MPIYALAICCPRSILHMSYTSPMEERGASCILIASKYSIDETKVTCCDKNYAHRNPRIHHRVHPRPALRARRADHFRSPSLEFPRLCALVCDAWSPFKLVKRELLDELCPRIGRYLELLNEVLAVGIVVQDAKVMSGDKFVKVSHRLPDVGKDGVTGNEDYFLGRRERDT